MTSRGKIETEVLKKNLFSQLDRLIDQLGDCESCKDEMSQEEYEETKKETLEQLNELNESLIKLKEGNLSLVNDLNGIQLAIQAAISNAFHTPEVIQMFAKKQQPLLRLKLAEMEQNIKLGKLMIESDAINQKVEILCALKKLGEKLTQDEEEYLVKNMNADLKQFTVASTSVSENVLNLAGTKIQEASTN